MKRETNNYLIAIALVILLVTVIICSTVVHHKHKTLVAFKANVKHIDWGTPEIPTLCDTPKDEQGYFVMPSETTGTAMVDINQTAQEYSTAIGLSATGANALLYERADQYYQVYYGDLRVSPLLPLAQANVETPGRADNSITWSALFPSRYVDVSLLDTFDVTYVAQDPVKYDALMHECSTRDRGALQMSPTYGTGNAMCNAQMTGTEVSKLATVTINPKAVSWAHGASTHAGDRFNLKDVLLRLTAAHQNAVAEIAKHNLQVDTDAELISMLAMYHHRSGVWSKSYGVGKWKSMSLAHDWAKYISSQENINKLLAYSTQTGKLSITRKEASSLITGYEQYTSSALEAYYPITVLYAYVALQSKYGGM